MRWGDATMPTQPGIRYLTSEELARLRQYAESQAVLALQKENAGAVREWVLLDTLLSSGLRAAEVAALGISDCLLGYGQASLLVRHGKGDKAREVFIPEDLKRHLKTFITWKQDRSEDVTDAAFLFTGQRGPLTRNGVWRIVKSLMAAIGLDPRYATDLAPGNWPSGKVVGDPFSRGGRSCRRSAFNQKRSSGSSATPTSCSAGGCLGSAVAHHSLIFTFQRPSNPAGDSNPRLRPRTDPAT
jgi:hypothetical protein